MTTGEIISICALCVSALVGLFAILTFVRNGAKDNKTEVKESASDAERRGYERGELSVKLDNIGEGVKTIKDDVRGLRVDVGNMESRVAKVETRVATLEREMHEVRSIQGLSNTNGPKGV